ncbi:MAG: hypothetical protein ACI840_002347, partial [Ulvibacter sp.]
RWYYGNHYQAGGRLGLYKRSSPITNLNFNEKAALGWLFLWLNWCYF